MPVGKGTCKGTWQELSALQSYLRKARTARPTLSSVEKLVATVLVLVTGRVTKASSAFQLRNLQIDTPMDLNFYLLESMDLQSWSKSGVNFSVLGRAADWLYRSARRNSQRIATRL
jgi:hypothetical protein